MAPKRLVVFLLGSLISTAGAIQDGDKIPESWCITYLSTYLAPVSDFVIESASDKSFELPSSLVDDDSAQTLDPAPSEFLGTSSLLPFESFKSAEPEGLGGTELVQSSIGTATLAPIAEPTGLESEGRAVVFRIVPDLQDTTQGLRKRAIGGFVGSQSEDCNNAAVFNLVGTRLLAGTSPIYYGGENYKELRGQEGALPRGAVTTTFSDVGGYLRFSSSSLPNGEASFCQDAADGQVYLTFASSPTNCVQIRLSLIGVDQCQDGDNTTPAAIESSTLDSVDLPATQGPSTSSTGRVQDFGSTESAIVPSISSPGPDILSPSTAPVPSVITEPSLRDTSALELPSSIPFSADLSKTQPLQTSSGRFSNSSSSSSSFRLPIAPTASSEDSPIFVESTSTHISFVIDPSSDRFTLLPETEKQSLDPSGIPPIFTDDFPTEIPFTQTPILSDKSSFSDPEFETPTMSFEEYTSISSDAGTNGTPQSDSSGNLEASPAAISRTTGSSETDLTTTSEASTIISSVPDTATSSVLQLETSTISFEEDTSSSSDADTTRTSEGDTTVNLDASTTTIYDTTGSSGADSTTSEASITTSSALATTSSAADETTTTTAAETPSRKCSSILAKPTVLFGDDNSYDDQSVPVSLPFAVTLFGESQSNIWPLPTDFTAPLTVFAYWDDLLVLRGEDTNVVYEIIDVPGSGRQVAIDWCLVSLTGDRKTVNHFVATLFEQIPGLVRVAYYTTEFKGSSATVGVQNRNNGKFLQHSYNQVGSIPDGSGLFFFTDSGNEHIQAYTP
ncbi:hypothetical protein ACHAPJ_003232 [Fusarium lateritium]